MHKMLNGARILVLALILVSIYPIIGPLLKGQMTWDNAVGVIASDHVVQLLVVAAVLGFAASLFKNKMVRTVGLVIGVSLLILVVQGTIPLNPLKTAANAYTAVQEGTAAAERCGYVLGVERTGENARAVLRDPSRAGEVVGYVVKGAENAIGTVVDPQGNIVNPECR